MVSLVAILIWRIPTWVVLPMFLLFGALDGVYLTSVLTKVPEGAWFTLLLAFILSSIFILWRFGKEAQWAAESQDRLRATSLLELDQTNGRPCLAHHLGGGPISTVQGLGIFFDKTGDTAVLPTAFVQFVRKFSARPTVLVFFHMRPLPVPSVAPSERYVVTRPAGGLLPNCYSVVLRHGYVDDVIRPGMGRDLVAQIELAVAQAAAATAAAAGLPEPATDSAELRTLRDACEQQTVYVLGKEAMRIRKKGEKGGRLAGLASWPRSLFLSMFLWIRENSRTKLADMDIDVDKLVEVGFVKDI